MQLRLALTFHLERLERLEHLELAVPWCDLERSLIGFTIVSLLRNLNQEDFLSILFYLFVFMHQFPHALHLKNDPV